MKRGYTCFGRKAADTEHTKIRAHQFRIAQSTRADSSADTAINRTANHDHVDFVRLQNDSSNGRRVGDDRDPISPISQKTRKREIGRGRVKKHRHIRLDQSGQRGGKGHLGLWSFRIALRKWRIRGRGLQCTAINTLAKPRCRHLAQITTDRIFRNSKSIGKFTGQHAAGLIQQHLYPRLSFVQQKLCHHCLSIIMHKHA
ncbi:hypothetical protein FQZ97_987380 [compost metagenome]